MILLYDAPAIPHGHFAQLIDAQTHDHMAAGCSFVRHSEKLSFDILQVLELFSTICEKVYQPQMRKEREDRTQGKR